ncbi:MAG: SAM-dependent methyltransferase, partial [Thermodesulfobacteriota bacterium]
MKEQIKKKERLDSLIVRLGFAETKTKAQALIMSGVVFIDNQRADKPGSFIKTDSEIKIVGEKPKYVSRGGLKLEKALNEFNIDINKFIALDIGASTGGFTDCLLQFGASKVYAFDVG